MSNHQKAIKNELKKSLGLFEGIIVKAPQTVNGVMRGKDAEKEFERLFVFDRIECLSKDLETIYNLIKKNPNQDIVKLSNIFWLIGKKLEIIFGERLKELFGEFDSGWPIDKQKVDNLEKVTESYEFNLFKVIGEMIDFYNTKKKNILTILNTIQMFNENVLVDPFESVMLEYIDAIKKDFPVSFANLYTGNQKHDQISFKSLSKILNERMRENLLGKGRIFLIEKYLYTDKVEKDKRIKESDRVSKLMVVLLAAVRLHIKLQELYIKKENFEIVSGYYQNLSEIMKVKVFKYSEIDHSKAIELKEAKEKEIPKLFKEITKKDFDWNNENDIIEIKMLKTIGYLLDFYFIKVGKNKIKSLKKQSAATGN
uniref:Uncharacterized protein n=1 Tax=Meloidogyne enterolobii TaxID=390850 RepID=A0A6V7WEE0_MELEN|nr:unnamed protein product [Meloidogyne enterolobii]